MSRVRAPSIALFYYNMTFFEAIILGIIQGLTEFFPISSSGHLELGQYFLGFNHLENYIFFDLICHLGTLLALFLVFWKEIYGFFLDRKYLSHIAIATLPLFPLVLIIKPLKTFFDQPQYLGFCFLFTAFLLYLGGRQRVQASSKRTWRDSLL
jgi:undecaprenyl-diphosphatase